MDRMMNPPKKLIRANSISRAPMSGEPKIKAISEGKKSTLQASMKAIPVLTNRETPPASLSMMNRLIGSFISSHAASFPACCYHKYMIQ